MVKEALLGVWATCVLLAFAVATVTAAAPPSVALSATTLVAGGTATATIADGPGNAGDWIGLYDVDAADGIYVDWKYLNGTRTKPASAVTAAAVAFTMPAVPGTYNVRLFLNDSWTKLATSPTIAVVAAAPPSIVLSATTAVTGGTVTATMAGGPGTVGDWVGLYGGSAADATYVDWKYMNGTPTRPGSGVTGAAVAFTMPATPGTYDVRFFLNDSWTKLATSPTIAVVAAAPPSIALSATTAVTGGTVTATIAGGPGTAGDWVGLYGGSAADATYVDWKYLNGTPTRPGSGVTGAAVAFTMPATPGTYDVRFFLNDSWTKLTTSPTIAVVAAAPPSIVLSATTAVTGGTVTATMAGGPGTVGDWVGLYRGSAADATYVDWKYLNGTPTRPGSGVTGAAVAFTMPATPGTYDVRFFLNDSWTKLTTSPSISVAATAPFTGTAMSVPGTVRADNFDNGGEGLAYHDVTAGNRGGQYRDTDVDIEASTLGGYNLGWMATGEWLAYTVNVATTGPYTLQFQVASATGGGQLHASFDSADSTMVPVPATGGWQTWTTVSATANLTAGIQVMKLLVDNGGMNLATITLVPGPAARIPPTTYAAISDRIARPKPALPVPGPAGSAFVDPSFGSRILRVTDENSRPGGVRVSYRSPGAAHQVGWSLDSAYFHVISTDGTVVPFAFDGTTMTASRIPGAGDGGLTLTFTGEPEFSATNPNVIYGVAGGVRTLSQYDFAAKAYSPLVNLDTVVSGLTGYVGGQASGGMTSDNIMVFFGGPSQDLHHYALWFAVNNPSAKKLLDTTASTLNGVPTTIALNFKLHTASIDRSGRYVVLYSTAGDQAAPRYASHGYIWDTDTDVFTALTSGGNDGGPSVLPYGHDAPGFGYNINQDCCTSSTWDAAQWQIRSLAEPLITTDLIAPVMKPTEIFLAEHTSWGNAQPDTLMPVISATYRYGNNTMAWRAWDDEIMAVETGAPAGMGATVWRFAHHRSAVASDVNPLAISFWYTPRANVSRNGRWAIFTSNWEKTIGTDSRDGSFRTDVFLVELK